MYSYFSFLTETLLKANIFSEQYLYFYLKASSTSSTAENIKFFFKVSAVAA